MFYTLQEVVCILGTFLDRGSFRKSFLNKILAFVLHPVETFALVVARPASVSWGASKLSRALGRIEYACPP